MRYSQLAPGMHLDYQCTKDRRIDRDYMPSIFPATVSGTIKQVCTHQIILIDSRGRLHAILRAELCQKSVKVTVHK